MKFKFYDIVSHLIPGFVLYITFLEVNNRNFDKDFVIPATAIAFIIGYFVNTLSSWIEDFYFFTWSGKPSSKLLDSNGIWKVKFYEYDKVKQMLIEELGKSNPTNDELFQVAMRYATLEVNPRVQDFNANYAFSRVVLTTVLLVGSAFIYKDPTNWQTYIYFIPILLVSWLRSKQRGYYFAKEVLKTYLKSKS